MSLPLRLRAGDGHTWSVQTQLPAGTLVFYVLTGVFGNTPVRQFIAQPTGTPPAGGVAVDTNGVAAFVLTGTATAAWLPTRYQWIAFALDATGNRTELAQGEIRIDANPLGAVPADPRTYNVRMLAQIRAVLLGNALDDVAMYKIGGRELTKVDRMVLMKQEALYESRVRKERIRNGEYVPTKTVGITFGRRY